MSDFQVKTEIKRTRKTHICNHCGCVIEKGSPMLKMAGRYDGDFCEVHAHPDCMEAGDALAEISGYRGEEYMWLNEIEENDDRKFIAEKFPVVAARIGFTSTTAAEARDA